MSKIAIMGANGQVGAEVCLLLRQMGGVEIIPICRSRSGSAFLRWQGIACRHGRPADPQDVSRLLGDCDVIVNFALTTGNPAQMRRTEDLLVRHAFEFSPPDATIIHFSTQSVYGDPRPGRLVRWRSPYGRGKLLTERSVRAAQRRWRKAAFILRLGHVCGELQGISQDMRVDLAEGRAVLPEIDLPSNTVLTVVIAEAIRRIATRKIEAGTYDLMNCPHWTWRQVYAHEAQQCGVTAAPSTIAIPNRGRAPGALGRLGQRVSGLVTGRRSREVAAHVLQALATERLSRRLQALWGSRRARSEIASLSHGVTAAPADHLSWVKNERRPFPQAPTSELLQLGLYPLVLTPRASGTWPADLPDATRGVVARAERALLQGD
ncbi:MAG TPA: NAD(P)-dependent oxidoreductase [Steroidobacteraceae bacterium]|nr:NAD(P)-dependent oxidoreductase [Steroidobacteraceae bacterium]